MNSFKLAVSEQKPGNKWVVGVLLVAWCLLAWYQQWAAGMLGLISLVCGFVAFCCYFIFAFRKEKTRWMNAAGSFGISLILLIYGAIALSYGTGARKIIETASSKQTESQQQAPPTAQVQQPEELAPKKTEENPIKPYYDAIGKEATVESPISKEGAPCGESQDTLEAAEQAGSRKDNEGLVSLGLQDKIFALSNGTRVRIDDFSGTSFKIHILSGARITTDAWIPAFCVKLPSNKNGD